MKNLKMEIYYTPSTGILHVWRKRPESTSRDHKLIVSEIPVFLCDAFYDWVSKKRDLANRPENPWEYVGKKPRLKTIENDWLDFIEIVICIQTRERIYDSIANRKSTTNKD